MSPETFGAAPDGSTVGKVTISGGGLTASILSWGCVVQDLRLSGHEPPLVLGYPRYEDYRDHSPYFGATAGRYANRIAHGRFAIDGEAVQLDTNFLGKHTLHGGIRGIGKRNWRFAEVGQDRAVLEIVDGDGEMGFRGTCRFRATFSLPGDGVLAIRYEGETDAPTIVNLAHHSYFNLDGGADILDHELQMAADAYIPVDEEMIPTGEVLPVAGSDFDFRALRPIRRETAGAQVQYDHNFCLSAARTPLRAVALARSPRSGVAMAVATTEPGVQFYAGHKLNTPVAGLGGAAYGAYAGFCLEAQTWPDSPNRPYFPQAVLRPGEAYVQETQYRFSKGS